VRFSGSALRARFSQRALRALIALALAVPLGLAGSLSPAAAAPPKPRTPTQKEIDDAKKKAAQKAAEIKALEGKLVDMQAELAQLTAQVEIVIEEYNGAMAELAEAQAVANEATAHLTEAQQELTDMRALMDRFAAASYRGQGDLGSFGVLLDSDSPSAFLSRASTLSMISRSQGDVFVHLHQAELALAQAEEQARQALDVQQVLADKVAEKKKNAEAAVADQQRRLQGLRAKQRDYEAQLAVAQGKVASLQKAREEGLAREKREREEAERRAREAAERGGTQISGAGLPKPGVGTSISTTDGAARAVEFARSQLGTWYKWSGEGEVDWAETPNGRIRSVVWDCSGLTMMAWRAGGVSLTHYSQAQWSQGLRVPKDELRPGDLLFFAYDTSKPSTIHHVGIYIGGGQMIEAPETGKQVRISSIGRSDYIGAVRP
jgi:cell wall-associated NlpC family hydrolase